MTKKTWEEFTIDVKNIVDAFGEWRPDIIVPAMRGGLIPAVLISEWIEVKDVRPISIDRIGEKRRIGYDVIGNIAGKNILLVEDDVSILDIYKIFLKKAGYAVDVAIDKQRASEKLRNNYYDALLLDLNLSPDIAAGPKDGLDILLLVRNEPKAKNLKVIALSNYNQKDFPELADLTSLGIARYFIKAETMPEDILKAIKEMLT